jgi:hypothetical protein
VSDQSVASLKYNGIIHSSTVTLMAPYNEHPNAEELFKLIHIDKMVFDDYINPTAVIPDLDLVIDYFLNEYRAVRKNAFVLLDSLQLRALVSNKMDIVNDIEADKLILRNLPDELDYSNAITAVDVVNVLPLPLMIDYAEKYKSRFN